jgi:hypothetical protein
MDLPLQLWLATNALPEVIEFWPENIPDLANSDVLILYDDVRKSHYHSVFQNVAKKIPG